MGALEFDPLDATSRTLLAGTGRFSSLASFGDDTVGLYYTTTNGDSWTQITDPLLVTQHFTGVAARGATLLAGAGGGLFRSTNTGGSWSNISGQNGLLPGAILDLAGDPFITSRLYAAVDGQGVFRTDNLGNSWTNITSGITGIGGSTNKIEMSVYNDGTTSAVYVAVINNSAINGLFRSANGASFAALDTPAVNPGGQGYIHFAIAADPTNSKIVYVAGDSAAPQRVDAALASGSQATAISGGSFGSPHVDFREMVVDANGDLIATSDGGIFKLTTPKTNAGTWSSLVGDLGVSELHDIAYDTLSHVLVAGTQDNGTVFQVSTGSLSWDRAQGGDGGDVAVDNVTLASNGQSIRYMSSQNLGGFQRKVYDASNVFVSKTAISTSAINDPQFITPLELNSINPQRLLIGGSGTVYESLNQGGTITSLGGPGVNWNAMVYGGRSAGAANPDLIYVGSGNQVYTRTTSGGAINATAALPSGASKITDVAIDPDEFKTVFAIDNNQVFLSTDSGTSWIDITGNLPSISSFDFRTIEYLPEFPTDAIAIGTRSGVFYALMSAPTVWDKFSTGLPDVLVYDLKYVPSEDLLVAGTLGRSAWTTTINQAPTNITLSANTIPENTSTLTAVTVGNLSIVDDIFGSNTLSISGGTNANNFQITGNQLQFKAGTVLNFEAKSSYQVTVTATDGSLTFAKTFTVLVTDVNEVPTNLTLSNSTLPENTGAANPLASPLDVGIVGIVDDALGTNVLSITGADAGDFQITGNVLQFKTGKVLDFETKSQYSIDLVSTDGLLIFTKSFTISLTDVNEVPTDITLSNNALPENSNTANPLLIGTLTITDDAIGTNVLSVGPGADGGKFQITGNQLQFKTGTLLDFETQSSFSVDVTSTDTTPVGGPLYFTKNFVIQLTDVNEAAVAITLTPNTIPENTPTPVDVGTVAVINDALGTSALVPTISGPDAASFTLVGNTLRFKSGVTLDRETKDTYLVDFTAVDTGNTSIQSVKRVTVTITNVNESPTGVNDYITLAEGGTATRLVGGAASVLTNDLDPDLLGSLDTLTVSANTSPAHGLLTIYSDGTFSYKHDDFENFTDSFTYTVRDIGGLTSLTTVNIQITPVNDNAPIAVTDLVTVLEGGTVSVVNGGAASLLANDIDIDLPYDSLTFDTNVVTNVIHGTLQLNPNGSFQYIHDGSETTSDSFQYRIRDALNRLSIGTVSINVIPVNDNPISRADTIEVAEGGTINKLLNGASSVLDNDSDAESLNSALSTTVAVPPQHGALTLNSNGTFSYVQDGFEFQSDSFVYKVTDPGSPIGFSFASVSIRIIPVNDSTPMAFDDSAEVSQGGSILSLKGGAVSVTANDTDADFPFDALTVTQMSSPTHGSLSLLPDGSFRYTHDGSKTTSDSFTYKVTDAFGHGSNTATVNISIRLINERPVANAGGPYVIAPGTALTLNGTGSVDPDGDSLTYLWDIKGDGIIDATTASPTIPWTTLVSLGAISGVTTVKLEVRDPSGLSSLSSTSLQITGPYRFTAATDSVPNNYIVSTINGAVDIRKVGTTTNLAAPGLTAVTEVVIVGSSDDETFLVQSPSRTMSFTIDGNLGIDIVKVQGTALADTINVSSSSGRIIVQKTTGVPFYVSATSDYIVVLGSDGNDTLDARQVTAALTGLQLSGENGNDTLTGGLGNDAFVGGDGTDLLAEVGPGNVTLTSDTQMIGHGTDSIGTDIEAIKLTGDAGNNLLDASGFTRFGVLLDGGAGDDTLRGTSKTDSLVGGDGLDEVRQAVSGNATLSNTLLTLGTTPNTVADGLSSIEKVRLTGNETANKMDATNFSGSATLDGGTGNDTLIGGSGNDLIIGGPDTIAIGVTDNDSLIGNGGNDTIKGGAGADFIDGGDGNDGLAGGEGNDTMKGGNGNDTILGQGGNDSLRGGAGRDLIQGGQGKDNIDGEGDVDTVMGGSGGGPNSGDKIFDPFGEVIENFKFTVDWLNLI